MVVAAELGLTNTKDDCEKELKYGMREKYFPAGFRRYVHVNRHAIERNLQHGSNYPTVIVVDENQKIHEFHAANFSGLLMHGDKPGIEAKTFIITHQEIIGYVDPDSPSTFAFVVREKRRWERTVFGRILKFTAKTPIVACLIPERFRKFA